MPVPISHVTRFGASLLFIFLIGLPPLLSGAQSSSPPGETTGNPHNGLECSDCHEKVPSKGETRWENIARGLVEDPVQLCRECHPATEVKHHPVELKTERTLPEGLPLSKSNEVICSTCHNVHIEGPNTALLRGFDTGRYSVRMDMCLDCHGREFTGINPHKGGVKRKKCYTCHEVVPDAGDSSADVLFKGDIVKICDFCHNVLEKSHPLNVDPLRRLPDFLPRDSEGEVNCGTCHDPHGTGETVHFLRIRYVEFLEAGRYVNPHTLSDHRSCEGCHLEVLKDKDAMRKSLRYGGDDLQICLSCHGAMDSCHPILVKPGPDMKPGEELPLSASGKITCLTCHDPMPAKGMGVEMRGRTPGEPINSICFRCHGMLSFWGRNPHSSMSDRQSCRFCHDTMTDPKNEDAMRVSFISNTRLICLRCHPQEAHPMGTDHMVIPDMEIPEQFKLDGKGKITCTTCHNPHIDKSTPGEVERSHRFVIDATSATICMLCHNR